jgi:hypothetical protein
MATNSVYGSGSVLALFILIQALIFWQFDEAAVRKTLTSALNDTSARLRWKARSRRCYSRPRA